MFKSNKVFRPHLDDVERLSFGKGAKRNRGTGSRDVCHRLNRDERTSYDLAKKAGYLTVRGTGYRKERKGSPLCNTYRQRCDALEEICIIVEKRSDQDMIVIDFSTLRVVDDAQFVSLVVKNVFQAKYPDLQLDIENQDTKTSVAAPIEWDAVKTKPIWGVNERLITVDCDRDVAKALAIDILKEIKGFDNIDIEQIETVHHCDEVVVDADVVEEVREAVNEIDYS
jgi:hypothetical protein